MGSEMCIRDRFKKAQGERVGAIPYGHDLADDGVRLLDNAEELDRARTALG